MSMGYKPSPLGYGSQQRSSPFRRPESPSSPASTSQFRQQQHSTPSISPTKSGLASARAKFENNSTPASATESWTPRPLPTPNMDPAPQTSPPRSPMGKTLGGRSNALSQLQPAQVRMLRDGFQILDRDSDGVVGRDDVADMLNQLGLPSSSSDVAEFFPPSVAQTMTLAAFLNSLATALAAMSPNTELLSAFSAFDNDDDGQVDLVDLRDSLLHTAPEPGESPLTAMEIDRIMHGFTGRRAFNKHMSSGLGKRGEVFKYQNFVSSIVGGNGGGENKEEEE
ncbi:hypothetical protein MKZ38_010325 [Zalerion maritima]|uniref:EF-hand domain-containing protein n=1 Tax=Zalerion maritima TaxID=339359 RepID=A0AAD5S5X6_9PEZI|nr:hypothetical protein MKZ38_010325 [Zalerion maritima]